MTLFHLCMCVLCLCVYLYVYVCVLGDNCLVLRKMTLQWFVVALILYVEIAVVLLLLLPWIRPSL